MQNSKECNFTLISFIIRFIQPRRLKWAGHVTSMVETRNAYKIFFQKPEGRRPLGRIIRMDLMDVEETV
jgi:hypothetical protein